MPYRSLSIILILVFSRCALADTAIFYEDNQVDYRNWGVRYDSENLVGSDLYALYGGISLNVPVVVDREYPTAYGHLRASLFPRAFIEPYFSVGIDLVEFGVTLLTDGEISPQIDTQLSYGLRFNLADSAALELYQKETHLTGYTIVDGTYNSYGVSLVFRY